MKIFIDFDDVIFEAKKFKRDLVKIFETNGVAEKQFEETYFTFSKKDRAIGKYYDLKNQIKVLKKSIDFDQYKLEKEIGGFMQDLSGYVFSDCREFFETFPKIDLYLLSYGQPEFQAEKIDKAGIKKYFHKTLITKKDKIYAITDELRILKLPPEEKIIFIDDRPEQVEMVKLANDKIITFHLRRPQGKYRDMICENKDYEAENLKQILEIIKAKNLT